MHDKSKEFNDFFQETYPLYKSTITFALNLENISGVLEVTFINELRNVLWHLYNYLACGPEDSHEFNKQYFAAREHIYRAYYDMFSLTCSTTILKIEAFESKYSSFVIHKAFPDYYNRIKKGVYEVGTSLAQIKAEREESSKINETLSLSDRLEFNNKAVTLLSNYLDELVVKTNLFEAYQAQEKSENEKILADAKELERLRLKEIERDDKEEKRHKSSFRSALLIAVIAALLSCLLTYLFIKPKQAEVKPPPIINSPAKNTK